MLELLIMCNALKWSRMEVCKESNLLIKLKVKSQQYIWNLHMQLQAKCVLHEQYGLVLPARV